MRGSLNINGKQRRQERLLALMTDVRASWRLDGMRFLRRRRRVREVGDGRAGQQGGLEWGASCGAVRAR